MQNQRLRDILQNSSSTIVLKKPWKIPVTKNVREVSILAVTQLFLRNLQTVDPQFCYKGTPYLAFFKNFDYNCSTARLQNCFLQSTYFVENLSIAASSQCYLKNCTGVFLQYCYEVLTTKTNFEKNSFNCSRSLETFGNISTFLYLITWISSSLLFKVTIIVCKTCCNLSLLQYFDQHSVRKDILQIISGHQSQFLESR